MIISAVYCTSEHHSLLPQISSYSQPLAHMLPECMLGGAELKIDSLS